MLRITGLDAAVQDKEDLWLAYKKYKILWIERMNPSNLPRQYAGHRKSYFEQK